MGWLSSRVLATGQRHFSSPVSLALVIQGQWVQPTCLHMAVGSTAHQERGQLLGRCLHVPEDAQVATHAHGTAGTARAGLPACPGLCVHGPGEGSLLLKLGGDKHSPVPTPQASVSRSPGPGDLAWVGRILGLLARIGCESRNGGFSSMSDRLFVLRHSACCDSLDPKLHPKATCPVWQE